MNLIPIQQCKLSCKSNFAGWYLYKVFTIYISDNKLDPMYALQNALVPHTFFRVCNAFCFSQALQRQSW